MNKIYKVVWSKVKNCYVVVSELAKNVITGGVKSTKVGSVAMAKGLALGAVMAFVITGSAMAADTHTISSDAAGICDAEGQNAAIISSNYNYDGNLVINANHNAIEMYGNVDNSQSQMSVTAKSLNLTAVDGSTVVTLGDHGGANLKINFDESLTVTGKEIAHGIVSNSTGGSIDIDGNDTGSVNVLAAENAVSTSRNGYENTDINIHDVVDVTIKSEGIDEGDDTKGHAILAAAKDGDIKIEASGDLTVTAAAGKKAVYAIGDGANVTLDAANVVINGRVDVTSDTEGKTEEDPFGVGESKTINVNITGDNITFNADGGNAVRARGEYFGNQVDDELTINVGTDTTKAVNVKDALYGVMAVYQGSTVNIKGEQLNVENLKSTNALNANMGLYAMNGTTGAEKDDNNDFDDSNNAQIIVDKNTATKIVLKDEEGNKSGYGAITSFSGAKVEVNGDLDVVAATAVRSRDGYVNINKDNDTATTVKLDGDIVFDRAGYTPLDSAVNINLANEESYLKGQIVVEQYGEVSEDVYAVVDRDANEDKVVTGMNLGLSNGATWQMTGDSFVNSLKMAGGVITTNIPATFADTSVANGDTETNFTVDAVEGYGIYGYGDIDVSGKVDVNSTDKDGVRAVGGTLNIVAGDGINVKVDSDENIVAGVYSADADLVIDGVADIEAKTSGDQARAVNANSDDFASITFTDNVKLNASASKNALGVYASGTKDVNVNFDGDRVEINAKAQSGAYGIFTQDNALVETDADVIIKVEASEGEANGLYSYLRPGVGATDSGSISLTGNVEINANGKTDRESFAIQRWSGEGTTTVGSETSKVVLDGDILAHAGTVNAILGTADSVLNGKVYKDWTDSSGNTYEAAANAQANVGLYNGATWNVSVGGNVVDELNVNDGKLSITNAEEGMITVGTLTGTGMTVTTDKVVVGTVQADKEDGDVRVSVNVGNTTLTGEQAKGYQGVVQVKGENAVDEVVSTNQDIKVDVSYDISGDAVTSTTNIQTDNLAVKGDVFAGDVSLKDTAAAVDKVEQDYKAADATLKSEVTGAYTKADEALKSEVTDAYTKADEALQDKVEQGYKDADSELQDQIDDNAEAIGKLEDKTANIKVKGEQTVVENGLRVDADTELEGGLEVAGKAEFDDDVDVAGKLDVGGTIKADGDVWAGNVSLQETEGRVDVLEGEVDELQDTVADHENRLGTVEGKVETLETTVGSLSGAIDAEAEKRAEVDAELGAAISSEIANRVANDEQLQKNIDAEAEKRAEVDAELGAAISSEIANRTANDEQLQKNIDAEAEKRAEVDAELGAAISSEIANRVANDEQLQKNIDAETAERQAADTALDQKFTGEVGRLDNRIDKVEDRVDKVGAMAAAMASLRTMGYDPEAPTEIAVGIGQYRSETGLAIGAFHYPNKDFMLNFSLSTAGDEVMGGIGATWKIGRKKPEGNTMEEKVAKAEAMKEAAKVKAQQARHEKMLAEKSK